MNAVVLGFALGVDMVNVIVAVQPAQVDGFTAIHTFPHLGIVQIQLIPAQLTILFLRQLFKQAVCLLTAFLIQLHKFCFSGHRPLSFFSSAPGHFQKDPIRRTFHNALDLPDYSNHLMDGPLDAGGSVAFVQIVLQCHALFPHFFFSVFFHRLGKGIAAAEQFHQIVIGTPQHIHNGPCFPCVGIGMVNARQKPSGQSPPTAAPKSQCFFLLFPGDERPIGLFQPSLK